MDINKKIQIFKKLSFGFTLKQIFIVITVLMALLAVIPVSFSVLRFMILDDIRIVGMSPYEDREVFKVLDFEKNDLWWEIDESELEKKLTEALPQIKRVKVTKRLPNDIEINVLETRTPRWYIDILGKKYSLDSEMYVIEEIYSAEGLIKIELPNIKKVIQMDVPAFGQSKTEIKSTLKIIDIIRHSELREHLVEVDVKDRTKISIVIEIKEDGQLRRYTANLGGSEDLEGKLAAIKNMLSEDRVKNSSSGEFNAGTYSKDGYVGFLPASAS